MATQRGLFQDISIALVLALSLFLGVSEVARLYRLQAVYQAPASHYIEPISLTIPDFKVGDDPFIEYERVIHQQFIGSWVAEVRLKQGDGWVAICHPNGKVIFGPEKQQPAGGSHLSWFLGEQPCPILPGTYQVVATWTVERDGVAGNVSTSLQSNIFTVS
jgi:hypothetical protein